MGGERRSVDDAAAAMRHGHRVYGVTKTGSLQVPVPECGTTICDDPEIIRAYRDHPAERGKKTVRYRVVNLANDDGSDPQVSSQQIASQHAAMENAFNNTGISWELS